MMLFGSIFRQEWTIGKKILKKIKFLVGIQFFLFKFALYKDQNIMPCLNQQTKTVTAVIHTACTLVKDSMVKLFELPLS